MGNAPEAFGLYHRGEDEPILAAPAEHADLLQRARKREFGLDPDYKVAPLDSDVTFAEQPERPASTQGLDQLKAEARQRASQRAIQEAVDAEVAGEGEASGDEAEEIMEQEPDSPATGDDDDDDKLTGDDLEDALVEYDIDASTGGSNADGSMNADEKRAAVAAAQDEQD